jgi:hypothetical protein
MDLVVFALPIFDTMHNRAFALENPPGILRGGTTMTKGVLTIFAIRHEKGERC